MNIQINELESKIKQYAQSYYTGESEVPDEVFDSLIDNLKRINPNSEILTKPGWGYEPDGDKVSHLYNLTIGSLPKVKSVDNISTDKFLPSNCRVSAKLDGISVVSYYKDGRRFLSLTRGNGKEGKVVTDKIDIISPQTKELPQKFTGAIRGEVLFSNKNWELLKKNYEDKVTNPRNVAAGIMNRDYIDAHTEYLSYVVYKVIVSEEKVFTSNTNTNNTDMFRHMDSILLYNNFDRVPEFTISRGQWYESDLIDCYSRFCLEYPCDGLVITDKKIKSNNNYELEYNEFAYKFKSESEEVEVIDVDWNATRTGRIIPRIWIEPIQLSGVTVQKCTGHNAAFIRDNKINKGTIIEITRSNEVIPYCLGVVSNYNNEGLLPTTCPNCSAELVWKGEDLFCENENEDQMIYRFISTVGNIDGAGSSLYNKIIKLYGLTEFNDLLNFLDNLNSDNRRNLDIQINNEIGGEVTKEKCHKILDTISYNVNPVVFLVGCNVNGLSWKTADNLIKSYPEYVNDIILNTVDYDKISTIDGFGYTTIEVLKNFEYRISELAKRLNFNTKDDKTDNIGTKFLVAITGSLSMKRSQYIKMLESKGFEISSNFKKIKYLITNNPESNSSKIRKAIDNNVEIISEKEFENNFLK